MGKRLLAVAFAIAIAACGGSDSVATTAPPPAGDSATTTTAQATTTTAATTTTTEAPTTTTTAEPAITFASLNEGQQEVVDRICKAAADPSQRGILVGEVTILTVLVGETGVPALEVAWTEIGQDPAAWDARLEAAAPICADLAWTPQEATTTTTVVEASATVTIEIGDFVLAGETEGCPPAEILVGTYWVGPNRDSWTDGAGEDWTVSLSVDASDGDLKWSFSTDGAQRWVSYHVNQSAFESEVTAEMGIFDTIFSDQVAAVSGGKPDTPGTVTIVC